MMVRILLGFLCIGAHFGNRAIELTGIVIDPEYQANGIGRALTEEIVAASKTRYLTAYTRNPSLLRILTHVGTVYPLCSDPQLRAEALMLEGAEPAYPNDSESVIYHFGRYGESGLYGVHDPAERCVGPSGQPLMVRFPELQDIAHSLVVVVETSQKESV